MVKYNAKIYLLVSIVGLLIEFFPFKITKNYYFI